MEMFLVCVSAFLFAAMETADGMPVQESPYWLNAAKPLVRHQRDTTVCEAVRACYHGHHQDEFQRMRREFRYGEIYDHLDEWCSSHDCWNDGCDDEAFRRRMLIQDRISDWICERKAAFEDASCYQDPFQERMNACTNQYVNVPNLSVAQFRENVPAFKSCMFSALENLPGCSGDNKNTFVELVNFSLSGYE